MFVFIFSTPFPLPQYSFLPAPAAPPSPRIPSKKLTSPSSKGEHRGRGGPRGDHSSGRGGAHAHASDRERPKKENILDLGKYMDKKICVKFTGGREVTGTLKGYDALMNLVLDDVDEVVRGLFPFLKGDMRVRGGVGRVEC